MAPRRNQMSYSSYQRYRQGIPDKEGIQSKAQDEKNVAYVFTYSLILQFFIEY